MKKRPCVWNAMEKSDARYEPCGLMSHWELWDREWELVWDQTCEPEWEVGTSSRLIPSRGPSDPPDGVCTPVDIVCLPFCMRFKDPNFWSFPWDLSPIQNLDYCTVVSGTESTPFCMQIWYNVNMLFSGSRRTPHAGE